MVPCAYILNFYSPHLAEMRKPYFVLIFYFKVCFAMKLLFRILGSSVFLSKFVSFSSEVNVVNDRLIFLFYLKTKICFQTSKTFVLFCNMQIPFNG